MKQARNRIGELVASMALSPSTGMASGVPPAVGVMVYAEQIAADFWALAGALGLSLLISLLFAGWLMQKLIDRQARREERP